MLKVMTERGDTLIEVTFALAILAFVLLSSTALVSSAFRMGQTARERTVVSTAAQEQMEALRSFRDNHTWAEFQNGGTGYLGIDTVGGAPCSFNAALRCFHMALTRTGANTMEWTPVSGSKPAAVPTSVMELTTSTQISKRPCAYVFELHYDFMPLGSSTLASNEITTKLANLKYTGLAGLCP